MALNARIREVGHIQTIDNGDGTTSTVDLSLSGRFFVIADYVDDANPNTVLETQHFDFPVTVSVAEAEQRIKAYGQNVRDARVRVNELRAFVGALIPLD